MSDDKNEKEQERAVHDLIPSDWDKGPYSLALEIKRMLQSVKDEGTSIDSGSGITVSGDVIADLWIKISGKEYHIKISKTGAANE